MKILLVLCCICYTSLLYSETIEDLLKKSRQLQNADKDDAAIQLLSQELSNSMDKALIKVFLGRLYLAKAANSYNPWKKIELAKTGIKYQDEAVMLEPDNIFVRLERYKDNMYLPIFMKRSEEGIKDIPILIHMIETAKKDDLMRGFLLWDSFNQYSPKDPDDARIRVFLMQIVYYFAGDMYARKGEMSSARSYMEKCSTLGFDMAFGIRAYSWLHAEEQ